MSSNDNVCITGRQRLFLLAANNNKNVVVRLAHESGSGHTFRWIAGKEPNIIKLLTNSGDALCDMGFLISVIPNIDKRKIKGDIQYKLTNFALSYILKKR